MDIEKLESEAKATAAKHVINMLQRPGQLEKVQCSYKYSQLPQVCVHIIYCFHRCFWDLEFSFQVKPYEVTCNCGSRFVALMKSVFCSQKLGGLNLYGLNFKCLNGRNICYLYYLKHLFWYDKGSTCVNNCTVVRYCFQAAE